MSINLLSNDEIKLIEMYKTKHDEKIIYYFFNKYKNDAIKYLNYKILSKWYQSPFEKQDFISYIWKAVEKTLINFDVKNLKNQIKGIVFKIAYDLIKREKMKLLTNGHKILNNSLSFEKIKDNFWLNNKFIDKRQTISSQKIDLKIFLEKFIKTKVKSDKKDIYKRVIYLKSCGFSNDEIGQKLNLKNHQIRYILDCLIEEGKKYFNN